MGKVIKKPIGVYDSGVGGLTVLKELMACLPYEDFVYFADNQHLPYGDKTSDQIKTYSKNIVAWFENVMDVKMIVAACNTSSAIALDGLVSKVPVIGTIYPILDEIMQSRIIGIIATPASVKSKMHENIFIKNGFKATQRKLFYRTTQNQWAITLVSFYRKRSTIAHKIRLIADATLDLQFQPMATAQMHFA